MRRMVFLLLAGVVGCSSPSDTCTTRSKELVRIYESALEWQVVAEVEEMEAGGWKCDTETLSGGTGVRYTCTICD